MPSSTALSNTTVTELLRQWPQTITVFNRRRMACVGCAFAQFNTVVDAAHQYGIAPQTLVAELLAVIEAGAPDL